jgi:hypothetical protein
VTHGELINEIITGTAHIAALFRNPSGVAKHSKDGKKWTVPYGVGPRGGGGHDLIGWRLSDARFVSIDAKVGRDRLSEAQIKWMRWVTAAGGLAGEARSVEDALAIIEGNRPA